jgi:hypothetical protein
VDEPKQTGNTAGIGKTHGARITPDCIKKLLITAHVAVALRIGKRNAGGLIVYGFVRYRRAVCQILNR